MEISVGLPQNLEIELPQVNINFEFYLHVFDKEPLQKPVDQKASIWEGDVLQFLKGQNLIRSGTYLIFDMKQSYQKVHVKTPQIPADFSVAKKLTINKA